MAIRQKVQPTKTYVANAVRSKVGRKPPKPGSKPAGVSALKRSKNV